MPGPNPLDCSSVGVAYVFDANAAGATAMLEQAGFEVRPLPRDRSPRLLRGLIALPSFASDDPAYAAYMARYAAELDEFVAGANVLIQLPQAAAREAVPPFLPITLRAMRSDLDATAAHVVNPEHPLLQRAAASDRALTWHGPDLGVDAFASQAGFEIVLSDESGRVPLLLEGEYGEGRIVLSAVVLDRENTSGDQQQFARVFWGNLHEHVGAVCAREAPAVVPSSAASGAFTPGSSILAVLPDTQMYALEQPALFNAQTAFIRANRQRLDIQFVVNLGDITNNNSTLQWQRAVTAVSMLDGVVPYALVAGNHDYGPIGDASTRDTLLNDFFSYDELSSFGTFGGAYEPGRLENTYHLFSIGGRNFVLLALEWGPRDAVIAWADQVMRDHADREGILVTHAYLNNDDRRYDHTDTAHAQEYNPHYYATPGGVNDGEELWQKLVRRHRFTMTLNGHVLGDGLGYLASITDQGNVCHQMLSNYQFRQLGGEGYLRLLEFLPDGKTVNVFTYSPLYDTLLDEADQNFTIELE